MAALVPTAAQAELISSLTQEEIPIKLRCAICSKLAVNAYRLPCCDQAICETCQSTLPSSCPVCEHTPVAAEDCKPNKSLRTTIRVFLRTEEKKREALRVKDQKDTPPATPLEVETPVIPTPALEENSAPELKAETSVEPTAEVPNVEAPIEHAGVDANAGENLPTEAEKDIPHQSIEEIAPGQEETTASDAQDLEDNQDGQEQSNGYGNNSQVAGGMPQVPAFGMGYNADSGSGAGFPGMGLMGQGGDYNQMQMMMAMQNGMMPNSFGAFPMGMPGMSMDPMAMQQMFMSGGFGGQGMGMNGMNMGMGLGGFEGGAGTGFNNGWNGQQWNVGQDNFNHPNATGMGHGDFGANNSGFNHHNAVGLTQGNFGQQNQFNDLQQNGFGYQGQGFYGRGRGRGRGYGYGGGRGGHGYGHNMPFSQQYPPNGVAQAPTGPSSETGIPPTGPRADMASIPPSNVDEFGREVRQNTSKDTADDDGDPKPKDDSLAATEVQKVAVEDAVDAENSDTHIEQHVAFPKLNHATNNMPQDVAIPHGFSSNGFANIQSIGTDDYNWGGQGNLYNQAMPGSMLPPQSIQSIVSVPDVPVNAPKGPKAMREGLPNTSIYHLRGRGGFGMAARGGLRTNGVLPGEPRVTSSTRKSTTPERLEKEDAKDRSPSRSRSRTRSPVRSERGESSERREERHRERRRQRHRSSSASEDDEEQERRRERRRRHSKNRSKRHEDEFDDQRDNAEGEVKASGIDHEPSRDHSPAESRRSSHRSRRDKEREREREREREIDSDREHKSSSSHKHRSSHRSHRSRSPRRSHKDRDREHDRGRDHDRHRDRSRERRHRRRDNSTERIKADHDSAQAAAEPPKEDIKIPRGPKAMSLATVVANSSVSNGIGIKGSARRQSAQDDRSHSSRRDEDRSDKERERKRDRDTERSSRHNRDESSSKTRTESGTKATAQDAPKIPKGPKKAEVDPHTLEREARNRERLLKEAQRIAGLAGGVRKRSRDDEGISRKRGRRSEVDGNGLEERIAKGESEREGARWGR